MPGISTDSEHGADIMTLTYGTPRLRPTVPYADTSSNTAIWTWH